MTELERARAHLGDVQCELAFVRANGGSDWGIRRCENDVLAALSWVWQEQQQSVFQEENNFIDEMVRAGADARGPQLSFAIQARRDALLKMNRYVIA